MKNIKKIVCGLLTAFTLFIPIEVHASAYGLNSDYLKSTQNEYLNVGDTYTKPHVIEMKINSVKDVTDEYKTAMYREDYEIDKVFLIDYTFTSLRDYGTPLFLYPMPRFVNRVANRTKELGEYCPTQVFQRDIPELPKFSTHPSLRYGETGNWQVAYALYLKEDGSKHDYLDLNFGNIGTDAYNIIWRIPVSEISK